MQGYRGRVLDTLLPMWPAQLEPTSPAGQSKAEGRTLFERILLPGLDNVPLSAFPDKAPSPEAQQIVKPEPTLAAGQPKVKGPIDDISLAPFPKGYPEDRPDGVLGEFTGSFHHSLLQSNPQMYGAFLEAAGRSFGSRTIAKWGEQLAQWAKSQSKGKPPSVPAIEDAYEAGTVRDYLKWFAGLVGSGLGSTVPPIATGTVGAGFGGAIGGPPGAVVGGIVGSISTSYPLNVGEAYEQFVAEGVEKDTAAKAALAIGIPISALDVGGLTRTLRKSFGENLKKRILKRIAYGIKTGAFTEFTTEGMQSALREALAVGLTGNPKLKERALATLNESLGGFAVGGILGLSGSGISAMTQRSSESLESAPQPVPETPTSDPSASPGPTTAGEPGAVVPPPGEPGPEAVPAPEPTPEAMPEGERTVAPSREVFTPTGRRVEVHPEIVEADDLITSHDETGTVNKVFPQELQPRDRSRAASQTQVVEMAANLNPALLVPSPNASEGAPIVGPDNVVESGNARTLAIRRAQSSEYRQHLANQGYDVEGFKNPVLIQRRVTQMPPEQRAAFTREANARTTLERSVTETAMSDAQGISPDFMRQYAGGALSQAANRDFIRNFMANVVPPTEQAGMVTSTGELSQQGLQRVENAIFARAYSDPEILGQLREEQDNNFRSIGSALLDVAPAWAQMRSLVQGTPYDITDDLIDAVRVVRRARNEGLALSEMLAQQDAFNPISETTEALVRMFFRNDKITQPRSAKAVADALRFYAEQAPQAAETSSGGLFGEDLPSVTPADILNVATRRDERVAAQREPETGDAVRPALDLARQIPVVEVTSRYKHLSPHNARTQAHRDAHREISGVYRNEDTGWDIEITRAGISKSLTGHSPQTRAEITANLPRLLQQAVFVESSRDRRQRSDIRDFHHFWVPFQLDGNLGRVKLTVREFRDGAKRHYAVGFVEPAFLGREDVTTTVAVPNNAISGSTIKLRNLLADVKYDDGTTVFPPESETLFSQDISGDPVTENIARGRQSVDEVLRTKGSITGAMVREDVGEITFDYGKPGDPQQGFLHGYGFSHIIARRNLEGADGERFAREVIPEVLARGKLVRSYGPPNGRRVDIEYQGSRAVLSLSRFGKRETWVLTGFQDNKKSSDDPAGVNPNPVYAQLPSGIRDDVGAEPGGNVHPIDSTSKTQAQAGAQYVPTRQPTFDPSVTRTQGDPVTRETALRDLATALGMSFYQGRIPKRSAKLGFFRPSNEEVRLKKHGDIETAAHEAAHLIDRRFPEVRRQWSPATAANAKVRAELKGVSYDAKKTDEGFAEFVRLWATQPEEAAQRAPAFMQWWEGFLDSHPEQGQAIRKFKEQSLAWFEQSALDRLTSKIGQPVDVNVGSATLAGNFRQSASDDLHYLMKFEEETGGRGEIEDGGVYQIARLMRGKMGVVEGAIKLGVPKATDDGNVFVGKGLQEIMRPVARDLDDFLKYAVARSADELRRQGRENLFAKDEIDSGLRLDTPLFRKVFADYQKWNQGILDFAEAKGIIDPEARQEWRRSAYIPFYRVGPGAQTAGTNPMGAWAGIRALKGGTQNIRPVMENITANAAMLIDLAITNEARAHVARLAERKGGGKFLTQIPSVAKPVQVHRDEIKRAVMRALNVGMLEALPIEQQTTIDAIVKGLEPMATLFQFAQPPRGQNIMTVRVGGKPVYYEVADPALLRALMAFERPALHPAIKVAARVRQVMRTTITLSGGFIARNIFRDTLTASVMSRYGFRPLIDSARGLYSRIAQDEDYRDFIANGGGFSSYYRDENSIRAQIQGFYRRKGINLETVLGVGRNSWLQLEKVAEALEQAARLGEYKRAREKGASRRAATYASRDVSVDFAMRGDSQGLGALYDTALFFKAAVNSIDRVGRGFVKDPQRLHIAWKTGAVALFSMGLAALNWENPLYDELEPWDQDGHWHFFIPTQKYYEFVAQHEREPLTGAEANGLFTHLRLPKIWEIGAVASASERTLETLMRSTDKKHGEAMLLILRNLMGVDPMPAVLRPVYEQLRNVRGFTGTPIVGKGMEDLHPYMQAQGHTSQTAQALGRATRGTPFEISPVRFEHLLKGYFNSWAAFGLMLSDRAFFEGSPELRWDEMPVMQGFIRQTPPRSTRYVTEFYDLLGKAQRAKRTMMAAGRQGLDEDAEELSQTDEARMYRLFSRGNKGMQQVRRQTDAVLRARSLSEVRRYAAKWVDRSTLRQAREAGDWDDIGALKRVVRDALIEQRNERARQFVEASRTQQGGK